MLLTPLPPISVRQTLATLAEAYKRAHSDHYRDPSDQNRRAMVDAQQALLKARGVK